MLIIDHIRVRGLKSKPRYTHFTYLLINDLAGGCTLSQYRQLPGWRYSWTHQVNLAHNQTSIVAYVDWLTASLGISYSFRTFSVRDELPETLSLSDDRRLQMS